MRIIEFLAYAVLTCTNYYWRFANQKGVYRLSALNGIVIVTGCQLTTKKYYLYSFCWFLFSNSWTKQPFLIIKVFLLYFHIPFSLPAEDIPFHQPTVIDQYLNFD